MPEPTADLEYFYPTSLLSTAREIIFLWVARMVMMGLEFVGDVPFHEVYIHSVIQAADGRRMSKSLGTGIDPLEMIDAYGADATRFGLLLMSSSQDVRFSEEKIAMGRNFANKLWNAGRLVLLAAEGAQPARSDAELVDRWITSRLARATAAVRAVLVAYNFSEAVDELYHFVWDEVCDWYLELVKPRLYSDDAQTRAAAAGHALFVLDGVVRLAHPFLPFVTEEIASHYGAAPLLERAWALTGSGDLAPDAEAALVQVQTAIQALRAYRAEQRIPPSQILGAAFVADATDAVKCAFVIVACWWAVFAIPLFLFVPEPLGERKTGGLSAIRASSKPIPVGVRLSPMGLPSPCGSPSICWFALATTKAPPTWRSCARFSNRRPIRMAPCAWSLTWFRPAGPHRRETLVP